MNILLVLLWIVFSIVLNIKIMYILFCLEIS